MKLAMPALPGTVKCQRVNSTELIQLNGVMSNAGWATVTAAGLVGGW